MNSIDETGASPHHSHVFLGQGHEKAEHSAWAVIGLCGAMMILEIVGGLLFGSIALVADGLHMSTHAGALLLAALAYSYARKHAHDPRFNFRHRQARRKPRPDAIEWPGRHAIAVVDAVVWPLV